MNYKWTQYLVWLVLLLPLVNLAQIPERPVPPRLMNDLAGILTAQQVEELENRLVQFDRETSTQVAVVTVSSLGGYDPAGFAFKIGDSWGVGREGKNNGVVVLVKPKTPEERGQVYISVGYGLEGVIPDAVANGKIIDQEMIPGLWKMTTMEALSTVPTSSWNWQGANIPRTSMPGMAAAWWEQALFSW